MRNIVCFLLGHDWRIRALRMADKRGVFECKRCRERVVVDNVQPEDYR